MKNIPPAIEKVQAHFDEVVKEIKDLGILAKRLAIMLAVTVAYQEDNEALTDSLELLREAQDKLALSEEFKEIDAKVPGWLDRKGVGRGIETT